MRVRIDKAVYRGDSLGRAEDGRAVFVPFVLSGELVEVSPVSGRGDEVGLVSVLEASEQRVAPRCVHFGACGGCQYQHAAYGEQLRLKRAVLEETMARAGVMRLPEVRVHAGEAWEYRNRVRLRLEVVDGQLRLGYNRRGSNDFLPVVECPIAAPLLPRAATMLLRMARMDETVGRVLRQAEEVEFFCDADEMRLGMTLISERGGGPGGGAGPVSAAGFERMGAGLRMLLPQLTGAGWVEAAPGGKDRVLARWGADGIEYEAAGRSYWVTRGGFFQVNRWLLDELVQLVTGGRWGLVAWDLYAGIGLFSRVLAGEFAAVTAVEASPGAASDLRRAMARLGPQHRTVAGTVVEFLRRAVIERERPELVVLDPPRAGAGAEVCSILGRIGASEITYVSCDPTTLSRDLKALLDSGYDLAELHLVDLFPQTFHLETVAVLRR